MYRIYAKLITGSYEIIKTVRTEQEIENVINNINKKYYSSYLVIKSSELGDEIYTRGEFYEEIPVIIEDFTPKVEVKATTFTIGRDKEIER